MQGSIRKITGKKGVTWSGVIELPRDPRTGARRQKRVNSIGARPALQAEPGIGEEPTWTPLHFSENGSASS